MPGVITIPGVGVVPGVTTTLGVGVSGVFSLPVGDYFLATSFLSSFLESFLFILGSSKISKSQS